MKACPRCGATPHACISWEPQPTELLSALQFLRDAAWEAFSFGKHSDHATVSAKLADVDRLLDEARSRAAEARP